jgi:cell division protein ZapB
MPDKSNDPLHTLEARLDRLIQLCSELQQENRKLRASASDWQRERVRLVEKNELARTRVEAMIARLKSLETE